VSALAEAERTSKPTMSAHVKRLEAEGFVRRHVDADDARRCGLAITPDGERKLGAIRRERNDWLAARLARLSADDRARLASASQALLRLAEP
jgi:DNA-binding MarR family transcriptional regulator